MHDTHAAAAPAAGGLDDDGIADLSGHLEGAFLVVVERAIGAGHAGHAGLVHGGDRRDLVPHQTDGFGSRADEDEAGALDPLGEIGILGEEAVTGVDGDRVGDLGRADNGRHVQIAVQRGGRTDTDRFVGQQHMLEVAVRFGVHRDRLDAQLATGAQDPERDLAPVGDQDLLDHCRHGGDVFAGGGAAHRGCSGA